MEREDYIKIVSLMRREVVLALGCTEPIAVALCAAKAAELLGAIPQRVEVLLSANILKNAMGVGIPGTDMVGLPIAVGLGVVAGDPDGGLEVLHKVTAEDEARAKVMIDEKRIDISLKGDDVPKLYIEVICYADDQVSKAVIADRHTNFVFMSRGEETLLDSYTHSATAAVQGDYMLSMRTVYDFATSVDLTEIEFLSEAADVNVAAAEASFKDDYGHSLGRMLKGDSECKIMGDTTFSRILSYTSAACDARMAGAPIPVMSNSGSGNQGIAATLPVVIYARDNGASHEQFIRSLALSHLTAIYIKQKLGRLSALCGCVVAATGSSCGITYLMGGDYIHVCYAVKNMIANLTGMICDGAKPSCALKLSSGVSTAVMSAMMAKSDRVVSSVEGIIDNDVDVCISNLTSIGVEGMEETDRIVLDIMTHKCI